MPTNTPLDLAHQMLATATADLEALYLAQAEDVLEVVIISRTQSIHLPVSRKAGHAVSAHLIELVEKRRYRRHLEFLEITEREGRDASIELQNRVRNQAA